MVVSTLEHNQEEDTFDYSTLDLSDPCRLLDTLQKLRQVVVREGEDIFKQWRSRIQRQAFLSSGLNLAHYMALRRHDLRPLQAALIPWGLSSLGRLEARVIPNLDAVIATLGAICQVSPANLPSRPSIAAFLEGDRLLQQNTEDIFGKTLAHRRVRIMVTLPMEAASHYEFVRDLLERGTNCVRINCAHDNAELWEAMIGNVHLAEKETGHSCKVLMDLAGPKPRLGLVITPNQKHRIFKGECLVLTRDIPSAKDASCFQANCTLPGVLNQLQIGATAWIDDGRIGALVESLTDRGVLLRITHASLKGSKLKSDKGLNFPDTDLQLSPLTDKDRQDLDFVATHADIVGYSFVQSANDIKLLQQELADRIPEKREIAIVAKIETPQAVSNLPELIVQAAGQQPFAVMIARGDLAIAIGYKRLAEIQEEILWICEAAHIPVIWATQVLENLVKKGIPSRAEMTDAAMAERAECVMLNKGPFVAEAVTILDDVLTRMQTHQLKKTPQLRALQSW
ncbi:pyruvate kinase [Brunnivagina elsteri]|uniref:Pyruvate kinase n=1 Tax=Brunnivagina elsteri CCALA 953 TaxID=987040 RepID=A0A2A2TE35_9CYAN|nr:pyruvate kinase [Calothrix elsteri]PAX51906.1 pyruvate kinase [Calothrix elsteri CCALA 953]